MMFAQRLIKRYDALKQDRSIFESHWQECAEYILPNKDNVTTKTSPGDKKGITIYDNTAIQSNEMLAGFLHGFLTNPSEKWFELTTGNQEMDEDDDVRVWLQESENRMMNVLLNSNFQTEVHEMYKDLGCFGTAPMVIEEDDRTIVRFTARPIAQCVIDENYRSEIDTVIRECEMEVRQIADMFGEDSLTDKMKKDLEKEPNKKYTVLHGVLPRAEAEKMGLKSRKMLPYASAYVLKDEQKLLREGGFDEFPWVVSRWSKLSGEKYGRSPGMVALPEAKLINKMAETMIRGAQKVVDPPLQLPSDGFILPLNTRPGGLNYRMAGTGDRDEIKPIFNDARIDWGNEVMEGVRKRIRDAFYQNALMMANDLPQQTAAEVTQRAEEQNRFMGPLLGRQGSEFLRPMIDRLFAIMFRRRMFDEPPRKLSGTVLDVRYSSAIAKAQRANQAVAIRRVIADAAPFIELDRSVADLIHGEETLRDLVRIHGASTRMIRTKDDVEAIRESRAKAQEEQAKLANGQQMADISQKEATAKAKLQVV